MPRRRTSRTFDPVVKVRFLAFDYLAARCEIDSQLLDFTLPVCLALVDLRRSRARYYDIIETIGSARVFRRQRSVFDFPQN